jgi:probable rRNA maturation factor
MIKPVTGTVFFHFLDVSFSLPERKRLKAFLLARIRKEGFEVSVINFIFCTDEYLHALNKEHLKHDTYTDIITFDLSAKGQPIVSDIYISAERVKENARHYGTSFLKEIHRVIFHGALHLCGYKDKNKKQASEMRSMEDLYLRKYFVSRETRRKL